MNPSPDSAAPVTGPPPRRAAVAFIFVTVMLDMLAMGMIIPVLPGLIKSLTGGETARAAGWQALFGTTWAVMQFIFMPIVGTLSDAYGRRRLILLSNFGLGLDYLLMAVSWSPWVLFVGRAVSGITAASVTTASAYIADVTPPERRAAGFGTIGAAFGIGFVLGPTFGGMLHALHPQAPFFVAAALSLANGAYGMFVLPESLPVERRTPFAWSKATPGGALALLRKSPVLIGLAAVQFLTNLAHGVLPAVSSLYMIDRFRWSERQIGFMLTAVGTCTAMVQMRLVRPVVARLGERRALVVGLAFGALGFFLYSGASVGWAFLLGVPTMALAGFAGASAQSLMSRQVEPTQQGQLQGALSAVQAIAAIITPVLFNGVFGVVSGPLRAHESIRGAPFFVAGLLMVGAIVQAVRVTARMPRAADTGAK